MNSSASYWIKKLDLKPHPEGGFYRESYRSVQGYSTAIYYLLKKGDVSRLHRLKMDELWHFYAGGKLVIWALDPTKKNAVTMMLGTGGKDRLQVLIPAGWWFGAFPAPGSDYALVGCTVAPAFEFKYFEMADPDKLIKKFPQHRKMITRLTSSRTYKKIGKRK